MSELETNYFELYSGLEFSSEIDRKHVVFSCFLRDFCIPTPCLGLKTSINKEECRFFLFSCVLGKSGVIRTENRTSFLEGPGLNFRFDAIFRTSYSEYTYHIS